VESSQYPYQPFYEDGIINEANYNQIQQGKRLLLIAKEPNGANHDANGFYSFVKEWNETEPKYPFARRIGDWAYGFLNDFPSHDFIGNHKYQALRSIAFMNVKKSSGTGNVSDDVIITVANSDKEFILKEIGIISPDVIICCLGFSGRIINAIFGDTLLRPSGCGIQIGQWQNSKLIEFCHPSVRSGGPAFYVLLREAIKSI